MLALLHQWIGHKAKGYELKNSSLAFDKDKCLFLLNAVGNMRTQRDTLCHKLYLEDESKSKPTESFEFCFSPLTKYLTVEMGQECGMDGFWISDRKECIRSFTSVFDWVIIKNFMKAAGFPQFVSCARIQRGNVPRSGLVFFGDSCAFDKKRRTLKCGTNEQDQYAYPLSPYLVSHPLYKMTAGCSFD